MTRRAGQGLLVKEPKDSPEDIETELFYYFNEMHYYQIRMVAVLGFRHINPRYRLRFAVCLVSVVYCSCPLFAVTLFGTSNNNSSATN